MRFENWKIVRKIDRGFKTSNYALKKLFSVQISFLLE